MPSIASRRPPPWWIFLVAVIGFLAALLVPFVARAFELPPPIADVIASATGAADDLGAYALAMAAIVAIVTYARRFWPAHFAPEPATETSKRRCMTLAVALGQLAAFGGAIEPVRPGVVGTFLAGCIVAAMASFGRDYVSRARGAAEERKAAVES